jgi:hypothetical protein
MHALHEHVAETAASGNRLIRDTARVHRLQLRRAIGARLQVSGQREQASFAMSVSDAHARRAQAHFIDDLDLVQQADNGHEDVRVVDETLAG